MSMVKIHPLHKSIILYRDSTVSKLQTPITTNSMNLFTVKSAMARHRDILEGFEGS